MNQTTEKKNHILIVDDIVDNVRLLSRYLRYLGFKISNANNGKQAIALSLSEKPDLILLDIMMPGMDGFQTCRRLKDMPETKDIPVIFMTALSNTKDKMRAFEVGGVDYVIKPLEHEEVLARVRTHLRLRELTEQLEQEVEERTQALKKAYDTTIAGWARALELRDQETEGHSQRVTALTLQLAQKIGYDETKMVHVRRGALLHDIGKMGIPDKILLKAGPLTDEERKVMQQHTHYAYELLKDISFLKPALDIPRYHHERWDGSGYNEGLKGEEIPLAARIFSVVDVWDALTSDRPYRKGWSKDKTSAYIVAQSGKQFDPTVVEAFMGMIKEMEEDDDSSD